MKSSNYVEITNLVQVIGCVFKNPNLFAQDDKYRFNEHDFYDDFHKITFTAIYNLWQLGAKEITLPAIDDYLSSRPKAAGYFKNNNGNEFLLKAAEVANLNTFDYYYNRMKKMSLLRGYESLGMDLTWLYNPNEILNLKKKQQQEEWLDNSSLIEISNKINDKIDAIKETYVDDVEEYGGDLGDGIDELVDSFAETPDVGYPFYDIYFTTVTRGARPGKFYLRSAATNVGKTRAAVADACYIGCSQIYSLKENKWISTGAAQPCLFIATEQSKEEIQPSALAFLSGVEEDHIRMHEYYAGEWERIVKAKQILKQGKITFVNIPDFSMEDIEVIIKKYIREKQVQYIWFDYIHTSAKVLQEIGGRSGVRNLREDNILFLFSCKLKQLALTYQVCLISSTQLNGDYQTSETPDQNLLRGAKSIADKLDWGGIMLEVRKEDREKIETFCNAHNLPIPNVKMSVYKTRGNRWKGIYLWMTSNTGICRFDTLFVTDWAFNVIEMPLLNVKVQEENAFDL